MNRLKTWLRENNKTQGKLAQELGLSRIYINRVANDKDAPGEAFLWRFYSAYGQDAVCAAFDANGNGKAAA
jgi:transcriptional regulator with XRE-family HTH domain